MSEIINFLNKLRVEDGLSKNTILSYGRDLDGFVKFLKIAKINILQVKKDDLPKYLIYLDNLELKTASISRKISCLKRFYLFLQDENLIKKSPIFAIELPKKEKKLPKSLSRAEICKMLDFASADLSEFGIKLSCMLEILYSCGLRVSELVSLKIADIEYINKNNKKILRNYLIIAMILIL